MAKGRMSAFCRVFLNGTSTASFFKKNIDTISHHFNDKNGPSNIQGWIRTHNHLNTRFLPSPIHNQGLPPFAKRVSYVVVVK